MSTSQQSKRRWLIKEWVWSFRTRLFLLLTIAYIAVSIYAVDGQMAVLASLALAGVWAAVDIREKSY